MVHLSRNDPTLFLLLVHEFLEFFGVGSQQEVPVAFVSALP